MNNIASGFGDIVCVAVNGFNISFLSSSCVARSSTTTIGYVTIAAIAVVVIMLLIKSRRAA